MAIRWIPGSGLQSYAPEEAKKQALAKIGIPSKSSSGRSSASSSNKQSIAKSIAKAAREKAAQEKLEAEKRRILEAQIKAAKTQEEKTKLARTYRETQRGEQLYKKILNQREDLIESGVKEQTVKSRDIKTGDTLQVTQWRDEQGNRVQRIVNKDKGTTSFSSYAAGRGGRVSQTGGVVMGTMPTAEETPDIIASQIKIVASEVAGKKLVLLPSGQKFRISDTGRTVIGARIAGNKLEFQNGKLVKVNDKWSDEREVYEISTPTVTAAPEKGSFFKGFQKVAVSKKFRSKEVKKEQEKKEENWKNIIDKMSKGGILNQTDIDNYKKITDKAFTPEALIDKDVAKFAQITGKVIGTFVAPIPGAIIWAMGDTMESVRESASDGGKITKAEFGKIVLDSATQGAILGAGMKILGSGGNLISKRIITGTALMSLERAAIVAAVNHGGILIKLIGRSGKNFISTYFMKDMLGNVVDITKEVKNGNLNNALRKSIETGSAIGGYAGGSYLGKKITGGSIFAIGKVKASDPEGYMLGKKVITVQKKTQLDVMANQLLKKGIIVLVRRGVYLPGKGVVPRPDFYKDSGLKKPTLGSFWRFDKLLDPKDQSIVPLPLFPKDNSNYFNMFKSNWKNNKEIGLLKRYIKTVSETPIVDDILIVQKLNLKDIKNIAFRKQIIKEYATKGELSKATQNKVLKENLPISDKNREMGFHDENEFVMRDKFKFKGRTDISWTYDPSSREYIPVVQSLKDTSRSKNFLSVLNRKKIITRTDAQFIADNYAIKKEFGANSILPSQHSWIHMKQVQNNIIKIMDKYPEFNSYWKRRYGSIAKAKEAMKEAMWHDIGKGESASQAFGTPHGEKVWNVWKAGLLPKDIKLVRPVALAIKKHETLDPRKLWYKVQNRIKLISPEEKIVATADRLDLVRFGIKIDLNRLPLKDVIKRLSLKSEFINYPSKFNKIIARIKLDKGVTKKDIKQLLNYSKKKTSELISKVKTFKTNKWKLYTSVKSKNSYRAGWIAGRRAGLKSPSNYNPKYNGKQIAYAFGYKEGYEGKYKINYRTGEYKRPTTRRPIKRPSKRPTPRPPKRPTPRPPKRPTPRPPKRPTPRPPKRPTPRPPKRPSIMLMTPKGFKRKKLTQKQPTYYVVMKRYNKLVKLTPKPLILKDARDYLAYRLDTGLGRSAWFEPIGMTSNVVGLPTSMRGYFAKVKNKLRPYKIDRGQRLGIRNGYIEKQKYVGDTKSEIKELQKARLKSKIKHKISLKKTSKAVLRLSNQRKKQSNKITKQKSKTTTKKKKVKSPIKRKTKKLIKKRKLKRKS